MNNVNSQATFNVANKNYTRGTLDRIKNHDSSIGYMAMVTDYLLFEKNGDYHLKLYITTWDYDKFTTEVKYINYIFTYGYDQFFRFCMDFSLFYRNENGEFSIEFDDILGAYCVVNYYEPEKMTADRIENVVPVICRDSYLEDCGNKGLDTDYCNYLDMWGSVDYQSIFKDISVSKEKYDYIVIDEDEKADFIDDYLDYIFKVGNNAGWYYFKKHSERELKTSNPDTADVFTHVPYYYDINNYEIVTEDDEESGIDLETTEPPYRPGSAAEWRAKYVPCEIDDSDFSM